MSKQEQIAKDFIVECWQSQYNPQCLISSLEKHCLHKKTIGQCLGVDTFKADCDDWSYAFPDYGTTILDIHDYDNIIVCNVMRHGTHLRKYRSTNPLKQDGLKPTKFLNVIESIEPTKKKYLLPATVVFTFQKNHISNILIEEDLSQMPKALGISHLVLPHPPKKQKFDYAQIQKVFLHISTSALSAREIECLALAICGLSAKHIATLLKISYRTVEKILSQAYSKLETYNKQDMIEKIYQNYLLHVMLDLGRSIIETYGI